MMRSGIVAVLVGVVGCGVPEPSNEEVAAPAGADGALSMAVLEWSARVPGAADLRVDDLPEVRWFAGECLDYGESDPEVECTKGAYVHAPGAASQIHLLASRPLYRDIPHEVLHWALDEVDLDDPGHRRVEWDAVPRVRRILLDAGL